MRSSSLLPAFLAVLLASAWCPPVQAQWFAEIEVGADRFWGGTADTTPESPSFRPYRPTTFSVGLARRGTTVAIGLRLQYMSASLALEGAEAALAVKGIFEVYSAAPEVIYRLTTVGQNELLLHGGPLFEVWSATDAESQTRVGVQGAVTLRVPLGGRFTGTLEAGAAVIPSPFTEDQLVQGFERRALWRRSVAGGLQYRL